MQETLLEKEKRLYKSDLKHIFQVEQGLDNIPDPCLPGSAIGALWQEHRLQGPRHGCTLSSSEVTQQAIARCSQKGCCGKAMDTWACGGCSRSCSHCKNMPRTAHVSARYDPLLVQTLRFSWNQSWAMESVSPVVYNDTTSACKDAVDVCLG